MPFLLSVVIWNTVIACVLAVGVGLLGQTAWLRRRPAVMHTLWLLVLAKFVTPAFIPLPVLPVPAAVPMVASTDSIPLSAKLPITATSSAEQATLADEAIFLPERIESPATALTVSESLNVVQVRWPWSLWLAVISAGGSVWIVLRSICAMWRFHRWLRTSAFTHERLSQLLQSCSQRMGVGVVPAVRVLHGRYSPFLWAGGWKPCIYVPQSMVDGFTDDQLAGILCHELAHHMRRDSWANLFAFGVATLCWWNPLAWMARRALRAVQELCCDALVLARLGLSRRAYAETLYSTLDFVDRTLPVPSVLASGWGDVSSLKARFRMIGDATVIPQASRGFVLGATLLAGILLCFPVQGQGPVHDQGPVQSEVQSLTPSQEPALQQEKPQEAVPQPSKQSVRAETLKANIADFTLLLIYSGEEDKPYYRLLLSVPPVEQTESNPSFRQVQIDQKQALKIIDYLAGEGFLRTAQPVQMQAEPKPMSRGYELSVSGRFREALGWDLAMLNRLKDLKAALEGDAAKSLEQLLERLNGHRLEWESNDLQVGDLTREQDADFQVVAQPRWSIPPVGGESKISLGLKVTNRTAKKMQLNLFETIKVVLKDAGGKVLTVNWGRDRLRVPTPLVISSDESQTISRIAKLERQSDGNGVRISGLDETGGVWWCDGLQAGKYQLSLEFENNAERVKSVEGYISRLTPPANQLVDPREAPYWMGKVTTRDLAVEIVDEVQTVQLQQRVDNSIGVKIIHPSLRQSQKWLDLEKQLAEQRIAYRFVNIDEDGLVRLSLATSSIIDLSPLQGLPINSLDISSTPVNDLTPLRGMPLHLIDLSGTQVRSLAPLKGMPLTVLSVWGTRVSDLSPLADAKLTNVAANSTPLADLSPFAGMPLNYLDIRRTAVKDLTPLASTPLETLQIEECAITDLSPLRKTPLKTLRLSWTKGMDLSQLQGLTVTDLGLTGKEFRELPPLRGMQLESLSILDTSVSDISSLQGLPLHSLNLQGSPVRDLTPLKGLKLVNLHLSWEGTDLAPLEGMLLETISLPSISTVKNIAVLRNMKTLNWIRPPNCKPLQIAEFWRAYDAGEFSKSNK